MIFGPFLGKIVAENWLVFEKFLGRVDFSSFFFRFEHDLGLFDTVNVGKSGQDNADSILE